MYNTYNMDQEAEKRRQFAAKKCFFRVRTKSVNKLEKIIIENPNHEDKYMISLFAYFHYSQKLNPIKHPNLIKLADLMKVAIDKAIKDDPYYEFYKKFEKKRKYRLKAREYKIDVAEQAKEALRKTNTSIRAIAEAIDVKYANLYNFLENNKYSDLSLKKAHHLMLKTIGLEEGWGFKSKEELISKMLDKWEMLQEYLRDVEELDNRQCKTTKSRKVKS